MARAASAKQFNNLETMRNYADWQMAAPAEVEAAREKTKKLGEEFREQVVKSYRVTDWRGNIDTWIAWRATIRMRLQRQSG